MKSKLVKISDIKTNPNNPRLIKDDNFQKLVQSVKDFPEMLEIRPIVVNKDMIILGGNMRFKACKEAWIKEIPIIIADNLSPEQEREFLIKDNVSWGEWDYNLLANEWDTKQLVDWGMDLPDFGEEEVEDVIEESEQSVYSGKTEIPLYVPTGDKPTLAEMYDTQKTDRMIGKINASGLPEDEKKFLICATYRHAKFTYSKIAEYYAHSSKEMQELMEESALVIIDYNKAIENGFVYLTKEMEQLNSPQNEK